MPIQDAMKLTLNEIVIMQLGQIRKREERLHSTRLLMWEIRTKHLKPGKTITPDDIFKLSGDAEKKPERMTKEKFLQLIKKTQN
ncbi:MAG: hypothetical protein EA392_01535 [Cryomorphaceae bacterium]|nr:MAG: hypothetical protein EA392_01535 [Cryomorphaceae bacterium]